MMKVFLCAIVVLAWASLAEAQTWRLQWTQPAASVTEANTFIYRVAVDTTAPVAVAATCATVGTVTQCSAPMPTIGAGPHTLSLTAQNGFGTSGAATLAGSAPGTPVSVSVVVTVSIP
jgi:hypothetical protein